MHVTKRSKEGLCRGCRIWTVCLETAAGSAGGLHGKDQHPLCDTGGHRGRFEFCVLDVSFISLTKVLGPAKELLKDGGQMVCLIKPQFEAGKDKVGKKGVVRDPAVHKEVIERVILFAKSIGFGILHLDYSPIKGPEGNIEYLVHIVKDAEAESQEVIDVGGSCSGSPWRTG